MPEPLYSQGAVELVHVEGIPFEKSSVQNGAADFMFGIVLTFLVALLSTVKFVGYSICPNESIVANIRVMILKIFFILIVF